MKPNITVKKRVNTIVPGKLLELRRWAAAAIIAVLLPMPGIVRAQATNIIYQDSFARSGLLNGSMPDTVNATGAKYIAGPLVFTGNWTDQNGSTENACFFSNNIPAVQGPLFNEAFLPIPGGVETGHIYTLTASILVNTNYGANWMYLAFDTCPSLQVVQGDWYAGMLLRSTNNPAANGNAQTFATAGTGTGATFNWTPSGTPWAPQFITCSIVLNLTNPAAMTEAWYTNGVQIRTANIGANIVGANNGMWPRYIAFGQSSSGGYVTNLSLTDAIPFPAVPTISEPPNNLTASQGQTATFWVNAVGTPDPTYQWMSNGVAITGATNVSYTTPALNMAYNGLNYSVGITNMAGGTVAGPATLTVTAGNPTVYSVMKTASPTTVVVNFSGPVDPVTSQNAANYTLNNGASVVSASAGSVPSSVVLTTSALNPAVAYNLAVQNVQDLFGDAMSASTSVVFPAGLVLNLRGDSGVELDANGNVAQWLDQTTNGNNASDFLGWRLSTSGLSLPGTTTRPAPGTTINGLQTVTFTSGNNTFLQVASSPSITINTNITIYCVSKSDLSVPQATMISKDVGNQPGSYEFDVANNGGLVKPDFIGGAAGNGAAAFSTGIGGVGNTAAAHVFMATRTYVATYTNAWSPSGTPYPSALTNWFYTSSNTVSLYLDGIVALSNAVNNVAAPGPLDGGEPVYIGEREDHFGNTRMNGQIAEILVFNTVLSDADRTVMDNYLGLKWFTPFFATPPPNPLITSNGFAVTIAPGPTSGSLHGVTLQWQENGTNIPGATNSSYTTTSLAPSDNNDIFSLIMVVPSGSAYTNTTTLNVLTNAPYVAWAGIPVWNTTNQVIVLFDEAVNPVTATAVTNYSMNNGASVLSAAMGNAPNQVVLATTPVTWNANPGNYTLSVSNVMDLYGYTMAGASLPLGLYPPNIVLWLKASAGVVTDSGTNTVNEWDDQSGSGNNFIQPSGPLFEPRLVTNVWGDVVLRFTNTPAAGSNYLYNATSTTLGITGDMSLFAAVNFQPQTGRNGALLSKDGLLSGTKNIAAPYDIYMGTVGPLFNRGNGGSSGNGISYGLTTGTLAPPAYGYPCVVAMSESGNTVSQYLDNQSAGTGPLSNAYQEANDLDAGNLVFLGYRADGFNSLTADLAEMIVTTSGTSSADVAALDNYLSTQHHFVLFNGNPTKIGVSLTTNQMTLSWPADHTGWQLQSNSVGLTATGAWYNVSGSTLTNQITVMPAPGSSNVFYRMFLQQP